jgi:uncharacterized phage protein (TIGR02218 family)
MKDLSAALLAHYARDTTHLAEAWRVTRAIDAQVFGWTTHNADAVIDGVTYRASQGLQPTSAHSTDTLAVDTLDITAFLDVSTEAEIAAGIWDGSEVVNFEYRWDSLPANLTGGDVLIKRVGVVGEITRQNNVFVAEIRGLAHKLSTRIGRYYTPVCPWRHAIWNGSTYVSSIECNISMVGRIHMSTISSVGSDPTLEFSDAGQAQVPGYFNYGLITMLGGPNEGLTREIRRWENQLFTLLRPFPYAVEVGNPYSAVQGDDHTERTCKDVFNNLVNPTSGGFGGFTTVPGQNAVYASPVSG